MLENTIENLTTRNKNSQKRDICRVCKKPLNTDEEKYFQWCTKHLDEFDKMCTK